MTFVLYGRYGKIIMIEPDLGIFRVVFNLYIPLKTYKIMTAFEFVYILRYQSLLMRVTNMK